MLLLLQSRGGLTAAEIAERLEVSRRTVYRDVSALGSAGVPIYTERGRGGAIRLLPGYRTDVTGLTLDEARALFVLTTGGAQADLGLGPALRSAVAKVLRAVPAPFQSAAVAASERLLVDPSAWLRPAEPAGALDAVQCAVFTDRRVRLRYRSRGRAIATERVVDPYGLVCKSGVWYLVADHDGEPRLYRLSRAEAAEVTDEPVRRRPGVTLAELWEESRQRVEERPRGVLVKVRVRRSILDLLGGLCASNLTAPLPRPDGDGPDGDEATRDGAGNEPEGDGPDGGEWAEVTLRFPAVAAARILLSFGDDVTVVEPEKVREDLVATATRAAAHHAGPDTTLGAGRDSVDF
ncbi:MAG: WYL domain-containing protein [Nocardiopsaceae bacterium]|nr:WYL domain-containing protein [Nocardiopsaceae bacterium]